MTVVPTDATRQVPLAPGALPLIGHALAVLRDPRTFMQSLPRHGDVVRIRLGPASALVVCTPELTDQVLRNDRTFDKGGLFFDRATEAMGGDNLVLCPHEVHRAQRRHVQPAFRTDRFPGYAETMAAAIAPTVRGWRPQRTIDVPAELAHLVSTIVMDTMFSQALSPRQRTESIEDVTAIMDSLVWRMVLPSAAARWNLPGIRRSTRAADRLHRTFGHVVERRRAEGGDHGDLLSALVTPATDDGELTPADVRSNLIAFFGAGTETTVNVLAWALYLLGQHPDVEQRLHAEVDAVLSGAVAGYDDLPHLRITRGVVHEALRLYPPAWFITRCTRDDTSLGGHPIPAGSTVVYSPQLVHSEADRRLGPDESRFDPERWVDGHRPPRTHYVPFGAGARKCIGDEFALMEATLVLASITARWRLRTRPGSRPVRPARFSPTTRPRGLHMVLTPRGPRLPEGTHVR